MYNGIELMEQFSLTYRCSKKNPKLLTYIRKGTAKNRKDIIMV